jgi:hypothetical protein
MDKKSARGGMMKAAIIRAAGDKPIYGDFADPVPAPGRRLLP